jgi:hypothetical protein
MPKKIVFSCILFFENESFRPAKYRTVTNIRTLFEYVDSREKVKAMNVYRKSTKEFMIQIHSPQQASEFYSQLPSKYE